MNNVLLVAVINKISIVDMLTVMDLFLTEIICIFVYIYINNINKKNN